MPTFTRAHHQLLIPVAMAATLNPFGEGRATVDVVLMGGLDPLRPPSRSEVLRRVTAESERRLDAIRAHGFDRTNLGGIERDIFDAAALFVVFHRHAEAFDAYIRDQLVAGTRPIPLPFARDVMKDLATFGFEENEIPRHVAIFFQMRRAFYFVDTMLAGTSPSMRRLRERLWSNIFTNSLQSYIRVMWQRMEDFSTLLLGETGTGKGAAAAAIGRSGFIPFDARTRQFTVSFTDSFLSINLSQYADSLIESELFGHKRGAFTGALETHVGVFGRSSRHGAILLDEIGETSIPTQIKLLRVLQERTFTPVGMHEPVRFEGRVIAATHRPLNDQRRRGAFRDDFYYRLSSDVIEVPSLRLRLAEDPEELLVLLRVIARRIVGADSEPLVDRVRMIIERDLGATYKWPGNVRELEQCVRRVILRDAYEGEASREGTNATDATDARDASIDPASRHELVLRASNDGQMNAAAFLQSYCAALYLELGSYEEVARRTGLDRRTVKKYILEATRSKGAEKGASPTGKSRTRR